LSQRTQFILLFLFLLAFRTFFGFSQPFFFADEMQTYLIGLKSYCEHSWPFFGPDLIVTETGFYTQIPGALEGILIGGPFYLLPIPEAPFILLNLLSVSALALLSWYISKRVSNIPFLFIFAWISLLPWNLHESVNIINPSWLLFGSVLFFIGFLEAFPKTTLKIWSSFAAFAAMGFGIFWNMQFHFSWILLPPFAILALVYQKKFKLSDIGGFLLGALIPAAFLIPTWVVYGLGQSGQGLNLSVPFSWEHVKAFFVVLARYFSLVSYEIPRFLGLDTKGRLEAVKALPILLPPAAFLLVVGWIQPFVLLGMGFVKDKIHKDGAWVRNLTFLAFLMVWVSFWFTDKDPLAHIYYVLIPLLAVYSFYVWDRLAANKKWQIFGMVCLAASFWFQSCRLFQQIPEGSLYSDRAKVSQAIHEKNYHLLGERRPGSHN
jgi:hypothetical protein